LSRQIGKLKCYLAPNFPGEFLRNPAQIFWADARFGFKPKTPLNEDFPASHLLPEKTRFPVTFPKNDAAGELVWSECLKLHSCLLVVHGRTTK